MRALAMNPFVSQHLRSFIASEKAADLAALADLVARGVVRPVVSRTFPLDQTAAAIEYMASAKARGKVVVKVA